MKVILIAAMTIDGKISHDTNSFVDWTSREDKRFFMHTTLDAGAMIMGSTTFNLFAKPLRDRLHVVMTRTVSRQQSTENVVYTNQSPKDVLAMLKKKGYKTVCVIGGNQIYSLFLKQKLVDELWLSIEPYIFGQGVPLVEPDVHCKLQLFDCQKLTDDVIVLKYRTRE